MQPESTGATTSTSKSTSTSTTSTTTEHSHRHHHKAKSPTPKAKSPAPAVTRPHKAKPYQPPSAPPGQLYYPTTSTAAPFDWDAYERDKISRGLQLTEYERKLKQQYKQHGL